MTQDTDLPLQELFGVRHRHGDGIVFGPPERAACEAMVEMNPDLVLVHYFSTDWAEVAR